MWVGIGVGIGRNRFATGIFNAYALRVTADGGITEAGQCVDAVTGILLNASLLLIPSGYKANKLYSEIPTNGNGDLTWTRASTALRTNSSGLLESMGSGVPRLSYMYGSCPAVLAEPQRTNLVLRSEEFNNAAWTKIASSVTANSTISPDGTQNADTLTGDGTSSTHSVFQSASLISGANYTISVYAKKNTNNFLQIYGFSTGYGVNSWANFDLNNGVVGSVGSSTTASIVNVGNGWYRCTISIVAVSTATDAFVLNLITSATSSRGENSTLSTSVFLWGCQFEAGAYPTTYIPTTSATATRVADSFSRNNIFTNGLISASGGTWFVELRGNVSVTNASTDRGVFVADTTASTGNALAIRRLSAGRNQIVKVVSGSSTTLFTTTTDTTKIAIKWNGTTADVFVNGTKQVSATAFAMTLLENLGTRVGEEPYQFIQQMALFPTPLSDTDCTTLTTL